MSAAWGWLVAACLLVFGLLAHQVLVDGPVTRLDLGVTLWLAAHRQAALTDAMLLVSRLHENVPVLAATALLAGGQLWRRLPRSAAALLVVPAAMLLNVGLKHLFLRLRPVLDEPLVQLATYSFPSGHGVAATAFYGVLGALALAHWRRPRARAGAVAGAMAMVLLVCFSRVYLGAHYLSDVTAAACIGLVGLALALALARPWVEGAPGRVAAGRQQT